MPTYAIHDGVTVVNAIVAETQEIAELVTGLQAIETTGEPWICWTMEKEGWRSPAPFPSWAWNTRAKEWQPPTPQPPKVGAYEHAWNESTLAWDQIITPPPMPREDIPWHWNDSTQEWEPTSTAASEFESWTVVDGKYVPPMPYPTDGNRYVWVEGLQQWMLHKTAQEYEAQFEDGA